METKSELGLDLVLRSAEGLREWRALALLCTGAVAFALLVGVMATLFGLGGTKLGLLGAALGGIAGLFAWLVAFLGAGSLYMGRAGSEDAFLSFRDAIRRGLRELPHGIGAILLLLLIAVGVVFVEALVFLLCKIPYLGPFLYFFLQPAGMVLMAIAGFVLWIVAMLAMAGVWDGHGGTTAVREAFSMLRQRPAELGLLFLFLLFMTSVISTAISSVLLSGGFASAGLGQLIAPSHAATASGFYEGSHVSYGGAGYGPLGSMIQFLGNSAAYMPGLLFGWLLVWSLAVVLPSAMLLQGQALIYVAARGHRNATVDDANIDAI